MPPGRRCVAPGSLTRSARMLATSFRSSSASRHVLPFTRERARTFGSRRRRDADETTQPTLLSTLQSVGRKLSSVELRNRAGKPMAAVAAAGMITTQAGYEVSSIVDTILTNAPLCAFAYLCIAPVTTMLKFMKNKSVGGVPPLPFLMFVGNCGVWCVYGYLTHSVGLDWQTIVFANAAGLGMGCWFSSVFAKYGTLSLKDKLIPAALNGTALALAAAMPAEQALFYIGLLGDATAIVLLSSPLVAMKTVIAEKDSTAMPFQTSLAMFLNASAWACFGVFKTADIFIWLPNTLGGVAAVAQLGLIAKYPARGFKAESETADNKDK